MANALKKNEFGGCTYEDESEELDEGEGVGLVSIENERQRFENSDQSF